MVQAAWALGIVLLTWKCAASPWSQEAVLGVALEPLGASVVCGVARAWRPPLGHLSGSHSTRCLSVGSLREVCLTIKTQLGDPSWQLTRWQTAR